MQLEGVDYVINWRAFKRSTSIFLPCLNTAAAKQHVLSVTRRLKLKVLIKVVIQDGVQGLRIWRL
jgi:hypothetical protein